MTLLNILHIPFIKVYKSNYFRINSLYLLIVIKSMVSVVYSKKNWDSLVQSNQMITKNEYVAMKRFGYQLEMIVLREWRNISKILYESRKKHEFRRVDLIEKLRTHEKHYQSKETIMLHAVQQKLILFVFRFWSKCLYYNLWTHTYNNTNVRRKRIKPCKICWIDQEWNQE